MNKLEKLSYEANKAFQDFDIRNRYKNNKYNMIIGSLNRISISDDEIEVDNLYNDLITKSILEYKIIARETHKLFQIYNKKLDEYSKEKKISQL